MSKLLEKLDRVLRAKDRPSPVKMYLDRLAEGSGSQSMLTSLRRAVAVMTRGGVSDPYAFDWSSLTAEQVDDLKYVLLGSDTNPRTINHTITAVRQVAEEANALGMISAEELLCIQRVKGVRQSRVDRPFAVIPEHEVLAIMAACAIDGSVAGIRDTAMISLAIDAGLRRAELTSLMASDYEGGSIMVHGRRGRVRRAVLSTAVRDKVNDWIAVRGSGDGPLFLPINKAGRIVDATKPLSGQGYSGILAKRCEQAGVPIASPDDLYATAQAARLPETLEQRLSELRELLLDATDPETMALTTTRIVTAVEKRLR